MMVKIEKSIINYTLNKLFFPRTVVIDRPGIIYSKQDSKFGSPSTKRRQIFFFEDILVNLQLETVKKIGKKRTQELYYKIGKKQIARMLLIAKAKKPPAFFVPSILEYMLKGFRSGGATVARDVRYDSKKKRLILEGSDNIFCRKSKISEFFAGSNSMLISFLTGQNIEGKSECGVCPEECRLRIDPNIKERYIPDLKELKPSEDYNKCNFPLKTESLDNFQSFSDFMKFKYIMIDDNGKICYKKHTIISVEIGWVNMIAEEYDRINKGNLFRTSIIKGVENIARKIITKRSSNREKVNEMMQILAVFGWGIPFYKKERDRITFILKHAPFSKYKPLYQAYIINGYLNSIFNKRYKLINMKSEIFPHILTFTYDLLN